MGLQGVLDGRPESIWSLRAFTRVLVPFQGVWSVICLVCNLFFVIFFVQMRGYAQVGIPLVHAPAGGSTLTTPTQNNHNQPLKQPHYHKSFSFSIFFLVFLPKIFHNFSFTKRNYKIILKEKRKFKKNRC